VDTVNASVSSTTKPLVVDLDGTLVRTDFLIESVFGYLANNPFNIFRLLIVRLRGKAAPKAEIANTLDASHLPYNEDVLSLIRQKRSHGCRVYLASGSNERYVKAIANHLDVFDGWLASTDYDNLSAGTIARRLVESFGVGGFDYVGNGRNDLPVWNVSSQRITVRVSPSVGANLLAMDASTPIGHDAASPIRSWAKLLRLHHWSKNALVFVPLVTTQRSDLHTLGDAIIAFFVFSLTASAVYILNDLVDLNADRKHVTKKYRQLAVGAVHIFSMLMIVPALTFAAFIAAIALSPALASVLLVYVLLTTAYAFHLNRKMLVDVLTLASLYTMRAVGGAAAISLHMSEWLLGYSMFLFTGLALIKRYVALTTRIDENLGDPPNRNYRKSDLDIVAALAAAASFNAVTGFALYISSEAVRPLYPFPELLWLICPILTYWLGRPLFLSSADT
jgi:4-hydroxybenzoate polyprenyltransferase/phosphoserine phosphatase